jgi:hypothetical protein
VLSGAALVVALLGATPLGNAAVGVVKRALFANNAGAVNKIKASTTPTPGKLLPLGSDGKLPASVIQVPESSVGGVQVIDGSLTSADVGNGSLTAADVAPGTFLTGSAMPSNRLSVPVGQTATLLDLGFGEVRGTCAPGGFPQLSYVSRVASVNLVATSTHFGSPNGTAHVTTTNGLGNGAAYIEPNASVLPQSVTFQAAYTDAGGATHVATAWTSGQDILTTSCIFIGQGLTTG